MEASLAPPPLYPLVLAVSDPFLGLAVRRELIDLAAVGVVDLIPAISLLSECTEFDLSSL